MVAGIFYPMRSKLALKARQTNPDSPPELIRQYQVVVNVLVYYSRSARRRGPIPNNDYFLGNGFSIVDGWTNVKKLLKRRT